jgi:hypothetical protein
VTSPAHHRQAVGRITPSLAIELLRIFVLIALATYLILIVLPGLFDLARIGSG